MNNVYSNSILLNVSQFINIMNNINILFQISNGST